MAVSDRVLAALGPGITDRAGPLLEALVGGLTQGLDEVDGLVSGQNGWSSAFDLALTPAPRWLGQLAGVTAPAGDVEAQRDAVEARGPGRGTRSAIIAAARSTLTGTRVLVFQERAGSDYHFTVASYGAETPFPDATLAAIKAAKPAGLTFTYETRAGQSFQDVLSSGATFRDILRQGITFRELLVTVPDPGAQATFQQVKDNYSFRQLANYSFAQVLNLDTN